MSSSCKHYIKLYSNSYPKITFTISANKQVKINGKIKPIDTIQIGDEINFFQKNTCYSFIVNNYEFYNICT